MVRRLDQFVAAGILALISFTGIAHGTTEPWSIAVFELVNLFFLLVWAAIVVFGRNLVIAIPPIAFPVAAFLIVGMIQSVTWQGENGESQSISIDPASTRTAVLTLGFLLLAHILAANFFNSRDRLQKAGDYLVIFGFIFALLGILQLVAGTGLRLGIRPIQGGSRWLTGPFVNHNHFAGYMELLAPMPVAFMIAGVRKHLRLFYGFAAAVMATAIVLTASRGGIISLAGTMVFISILAIAWKNRIRRTVVNSYSDTTTHSRRTIKEILAASGILGVFLAAIVFGTFWLGNDQIVGRLIEPTSKNESFEASRGWIWKTSGRMVRDNWVIGIGLGAYGTGYPRYSDRNEDLIVDRAHNDYLQVLTDTGLIGGIIVLSFLVIFAYNIFRVLDCADPVEGAVSVGSAAAGVSLLIHSFFDFNLQIPATALLFFVLNAFLSQAVRLNIKKSRT